MASRNAWAHLTTSLVLPFEGVNFQLSSMGGLPGVRQLLCGLLQLQVQLAHSSTLLSLAPLLLTLHSLLQLTLSCVLQTPSTPS